MKVRPSALIIQDNNVLTLKYTYPQGVIYALPGGNLEFGEELKTALQRELQEEIGIQTVIGEIAHIAEVLLHKENTVHIVFDCKTFTGNPLVNPVETKAEEIVWIPLDSLGQYTLYPNIGQFVKRGEVFLGVIDQPRF